MLQFIYTRILLVWDHVSRTARTVDHLNRELACVQGELRHLTKLVEQIRDEVVPRPVASIQLIAGPIEEQPT